MSLFLIGGFYTAYQRISIQPIREDDQTACLSTVSSTGYVHIPSHEHMHTLYKISAFQLFC